MITFPERRRARRYLTLKNAGVAGIVLCLGFILLSLWSEFRPHSGASGGLRESPVRASDSTLVRHDLTIVDEGPSGGQPGADSLLLDSGAQDQLRAAAEGSAAQALSTASEERDFEHRTSQLGKGQRITISGGSEGVLVQAEPIPAASQTIQAPEPPR